MKTLLYDLRLRQHCNQMGLTKYAWLLFTNQVKEGLQSDRQPKQSLSTFSKAWSIRTFKKMFPKSCTIILLLAATCWLNRPDDYVIWPEKKTGLRHTIRTINGCHSHMRCYKWSTRQQCLYLMMQSTQRQLLVNCNWSESQNTLLLLQTLTLLFMFLQKWEAVMSIV